MLRAHLSPVVVKMYPVSESTGFCEHSAPAKKKKKKQTKLHGYRLSYEHLPTIMLKIISMGPARVKRALKRVVQGADRPMFCNNWSKVGFLSLFYRVIFIRVMSIHRTVSPHCVP